MNDKGTILVVGGGISGLTAALEAADVGCRVILVEKEPFLGGRVGRMFRYFPKMCPPGCGLEINFRRLRNNPRIEVFTRAEVTAIRGCQGDFSVTVKQSPRFVNRRCTACGDCVAACPVERPNDLNANLDKTRAIYFLPSLAYPMRFVIDPAVCRGESCGACVRACPYGAIDLAEAESSLTLDVAGIVFATGWKPYDARKLDRLGFGRHPNVVTSPIMERLASPDGPSGGRILRPSDGQPPARIAFVQCAGSRDENHLRYCSSVCCSASLKQARYLRAQYPEAEIWMYYLDVRTPGHLERFLTGTTTDPKFHLVKGKVAAVAENPVNRNPVIEVEDMLAGRKERVEVDLLVLALGMEPNVVHPSLKDHFVRDDDGFADADRLPAGIQVCGVARKPVDVTTAVQDATAAVLRAIQSLGGR